MLRKIISIPEGVYYRGRFRASLAWSKVSRRRGEGDSVVEEEEVSRGIDAPEALLRERTVSARIEPRSLQVRPTGR
jgi:hypothetical protein